MTINVGERIRQVRLMRGMTQETLAEKVLIKKSTISAYVFMAEYRHNTRFCIKITCAMET